MSQPKDYPKTNEFYVKDSIGVPHPYCIGTRHISYASKYYNGMLSGDSIRNLEKQRGKPCCYVKGCDLSYDDHKQALLIAVKGYEDLNDCKEKLQEYLLLIKDKAESEGYVGFAFIKDK